MKNHSRIMNILRQPLMSEKSAIVADKYRQITFKVIKDASKEEIQQAVSLVFNVEVQNVSTLNVKGKNKGRGKYGVGKRCDWKKAYVTLKEGYDIDFSGTE